MAAFAGVLIIFTHDCPLLIEMSVMQAFVLANGGFVDGMNRAGQSLIEFFSRLLRC